MQIKIKATNINLTPEIENYINKRLNFLDKFVKDDSGALCQVEVGRTTFHHKKGEVFRAEVNLTTVGRSLYAATEGEDLYSAIDGVKSEIKNRVLSFKEKKETLLKRGGRQVKLILKGIWRK